MPWHWWMTQNTATFKQWAPASASDMAAAASVGDSLCEGRFAAVLPFKASFLPRKSLSRDPPSTGGCLCVTTWGVQTSQKSCQDLLLGGENTWAVVLACPEERWHFGGKEDFLVVLLLSSEHLLSRGKINKWEQYFGLHKSSCYSLLSEVSSGEWLLSSRGGRWSL